MSPININFERVKDLGNTFKKARSKTAFYHHSSLMHYSPSRTPKTSHQTGKCHCKKFWKADWKITIFLKYKTTTKIKKIRQLHHTHIKYIISLSQPQNKQENKASVPAKVFGLFSSCSYPRSVI